MNGNNVHQMMQHIPTLDEAAQEACQKEVTEALSKYNCHLVFQTIQQNGQVVNGQFLVIKNPT